MWQELIVGIIVALAALYAGAKYLPAAWRRAVVHRLSKGGRQPVLANRLVKFLDTSASCGGGCNSCNTCDDGESGQPGQPAEPAPPRGKGRVIRIHERR